MDIPGKIYIYSKLEKIDTEEFVGLALTSEVHSEGNRLQQFPNVKHI